MPKPSAGRTAFRTPTPERFFSPSWALYEAGKFQRSLAPHEVAERLREHGASIVQANHPRSGRGVFGFIGLDPATGAVSGTWPDIDCAEILNGKRLDEYDLVLADFFALVSTGRGITLTGSSDTHSEFSGIGYARTLVRAESTRDLESVFAALREGRAIAVNGPYVFATANGAATVKQLHWSTLDCGEKEDRVVRLHRGPGRAGAASVRLAIHQRRGIDLAP